MDLYPYNFAIVQLLNKIRFNNYHIPGGSVGKESTCKVGATGDAGSILGWGRSPGEGNDNPLQYSCLENSIDSGAWWATVHWVAKESDTTE